MNEEYLIRIILRARDEMANAFANARREVADLRTEFRGMQGDVDTLNRSLTGLNTRLTNLRTRVQGVREDLVGMSSQTRTAADSFGSMADRAGEASNELRVVRDDTHSVETSQRGLIATTDRWGQAMQRVGIEVRSLGSEMRGLLILGVIGFFQQIVTAAIALGGNLVALGSSAAYAGAALGGALAAGAAQALPALGLLIAAFQRVGAVMDALEQRQNAQQQQATQATQGAERQADAAGRVADAQDALVAANVRLEGAHRTLADAQDRLTDAREDAREELDDLVLAERRAELAARGASLSLEEAQRELREAIQSGDEFRVRQARFGVDEARLARDEARDNLREVRTDNAEARRQGVEGADQVVQARRAVQDARQGIEDARRGIAAARRNIVEARRDAETANAQVVTAQRNLDFLLSQMSESERGLYRALVSLRGTYDELVRPITDIIVDSFARTVGEIEDVIRNDRVLGAFTTLAEAIAGGIDELTDAATSDQAIAQWVRIIEQAADNIGPFVDLLVNLSGIFLDIAEAAGPAFRTILDWVVRITDGWGEFIREGRRTGELGEFFQQGVTHLQSWLRLLGAVVNLFAALAGEGGAASGLRIIERMTRGINGWADAVRRNGREVDSFFRDAEFVLGQIWRLLEAVALALFRAFEPDTVEALVNILVDVVLPALEKIIDAVGELVQAIEWFLTEPFGGIVGQFALWAGAILGVWRALTVLTGLMGTGLRTFAQMAGAVTTLRATVGGLRAAFAALAGGQGIGAAIAAFRNYIGQARAARTATTVTAATTGAAAGGAAAAGAAGAATVLLPDGRRVMRNSPAHREAEEAERQARRGQRRGRLMRGAGVLGVIGAGVGLSQATGDIDELSDATDTLALKLENLEGVFGDLLSFNFGGVFGRLNDDFSELGVFAEDAEIQLRRFTDQGNDAELAALARRARDMAEDFPDAADALNAFADRAEAAADEARRLNRVLDDTGDFGDRIRREGGIEAEDIIRPNAVAQFLSNMRRLSNVGITSVQDLRENMRFNLEQINEGFEQGSKSWQLAIAQNAGQGIRSLRQAMRDGRISTEQGMREIARITRQQMRFARDNMDELSDDARDRLARNFRNARLAVENQVGGIEEATGATLRRIRRLMREELALYGISERQARNIARGGNRGRQFGDTDQNLGREGGASDIIDYGGAVGGFFGMPGERGADDPRVRVAGRHPIGRGEAVMNWAHQNYVEPALHAYYGHGLQRMFERVRGAHAWQFPGLGMARGGQIVGVPGFPGERAARSVLDEILYYTRRFGLTLTDAFGPGHQSPGHTLFGTAADLAGPDLNMDRAAAALVRAGFKVLYDGRFGTTAWPGHGPSTVAGDNAHIHVEFGSKSGNAPDLINAISRRAARVRGAGGAGVVGGIAQAAANMVRAGANEMLNRVATDLGTEGAENVPAMDPDTNVVAAFRRAIRVTGADSKAQLALWMAGIVESGLRNLAYGDADSQGALQLRTGLHGTGLAMNPFQSAVAFLTRGFFGKGGAISLAQENARATAGWIAQQVQGSAFPERYDQARARAMRYMGFMFGGEVPGFGGGDRFPIFAEGGEHVWTKEEVERAGGHGVLRALRRMFGGGGQGGPLGFQGGGEVAPRPGYLLPALDPLNPSGVIREMERLNRALRRMQRRSEESMREYTDRVLEQVNALTGEGGLLEQLTASLERRRQARTTRLTQDTFSRRGGRIVRDLSPEQVLQRQIGAIGADNRNLRGAREELEQSGSRLDRQEAEVGQRIAVLRQGRETEAERREIRRLLQRRDQLRGAQRQIAEGVRAIDQEIADNIARRYELELQQIQNAVEQTNRQAQSRIGAADRGQRIAEMLGQSTDHFHREREAAMAQQINELRAHAEAFRARGEGQMAADIDEQIAELQSAIQEAAIQQFQQSIQDINDRAGRRMARLDTTERAIALGVSLTNNAAGGVFTGLSTRAQVFAQRADVLADQRRELEGRYQIAALQGNVAAMQDLQQQIADLTVAIAENTLAARQARIDAINAQAGFVTGVSGQVRQLLEALGMAPGASPDQGMIGQMIQMAMSALGTQAEGLTSELEGILGIDIGGLGSPQEIQEFINTVLPLINLLPEEIRNQAQQLVEALLNNANETAGLANEMAELNGQNAQSFSSSVWEAFRYAVFTGSGAVVPGMMPSFQSGGVMPWDGMAYLHQGEIVSNPRLGQHVGEHHDHFHITTPKEVVDYQTLAREAGWARRTSGR